MSGGLGSFLAGLVLAGGEGRRWGEPKAGVRLPDGRTFLAACGEALRGAGARPVVATLPAGWVMHESVGLDCCPLPAAGLDMFASLRYGLSRLLDDPGWSKVSVLPVDHPLVRPETILALAGECLAASIPSYYGKHGHPVCLGRDLAGRIAARDYAGPTLRDVLRAVGVRVVPVDDAGVVINCNTPEALARALRSAD